MIYALIIAFALFAVLFFISIEFIKEKELKAFYKSVSLSVALPTPFLIAWYFNYALLAIILISFFSFAILLLLIPYRRNRFVLDRDPLNKYDERDTMFSRRELLPGSEKYKAYYLNNPSKEELDNKFRNEAGLLSPHSLFYNPIAFNAANKTFETIDKLHPLVDGKVYEIKTDESASQISKYIKEWAMQLGAVDIGITELKPYHLYSHKGRGKEYGDEINSTHKFAIAFTVEMSHEMVKPAPQTSIVMESAKQYLKAGEIAVLIAQHIRSLGFSARAHIDGNYQLICPLVARDAGLGEIGRMGLLMTPKLGPRVRIGVITTSIELVQDKYKPDSSVEQFCLLCKKCATCCPGKSIPTNPPKMIKGIKRWQINSESCYTYWCIAGTDCGRCMAVCPYSHPNTLLHNFVRWGIRNNPIFRILAVHLDDFFYGKKPKPKQLPNWMNM